MFDDRLGRGSSMQTYYRLSVCMVDASKRGRPSLGLFRSVSKRWWIVAFMIEMRIVYTPMSAYILPCCRQCCRQFFDPFLALYLV